MTKYKFRKQNVFDKCLIDIPSDALIVQIYATSSKPLQLAVVWIEEVPLEAEV